LSYKIYKIDNIANKKRLCEISDIQSVNWQDNGLSSVFLSFDFTAPKALFGYEELYCGDWIELYEKDDKEAVFYGIITSKNQTSKDFYTYSGYDIGFYLEKNSIIKQFKGEKISKALQAVCAEYAIPVNEILDINQEVKKIYKNEKLSDVLLDLYKIAVSKGLEDKYFFDCRSGYLKLLEYEKNNALKGYIANIYSVNSFDSINAFDIKTSIEEMKTRVQIFKPAKGKEASAVRCCTVSADENIQKYGLLNHIEEVDADAKINYEEVANRKLQELNKIEETISLTVLGDYNVHKGVITDINKPEIGVQNASCLITSSVHNIAGTKETVTISIKKIGQIE